MIIQFILEAVFVVCRMVLKYLIPVKLSLGVMPSKSLLERYGLLEVCLQLSQNCLFGCHLGFVSVLILPSRVQYKDVIQALRTGDIRLLRQALQTHEDQYVSFVPFEHHIPLSAFLVFDPTSCDIRRGGAWHDKWMVISDFCGLVYI